MYAQFGRKWVCLHRGPAWQFDEEIEEQENVVTDIMDSDRDTTTSSFMKHGEEEHLSDLTYTQMEGSADQSEVIQGDIIGTALGQCGIIFETESNENELDIEGKISQLAADISNVTLVSQFCCEDVQQKEISTLLSSNASECMEELGYATNKPEDVEKYFHVRPRTGTRKRNKNIYNPRKAKINIAGAGLRHLQRKIQSKGFKRCTDIQTKLLKEAHQRFPQGCWWIKADACDLRSGLCESLQGDWSGDKDLGDGKLKMMHDEYKAKKKNVKQLHVVCGDNFFKGLLVIKNYLANDNLFLQNGLKEATDIYNHKIDTSQDTLLCLAWDVTGYSELLKINEDLLSSTYLLLDEQNHTTALKGWLQLCDKFCDYLKQLYLRKREAASHLLVFMIAEEQRKFKPYAIPLRVLPVVAVTDKMMREMRNELVFSMEELGMKVVGFVTDGEWNSLRTQGQHRAVSIIQLLMGAKKEAQSIKIADIENIFKPTGPEGKAKVAHKAVPQSEIKWMHDFMEGGKIPFKNAIHMRRRMYPFHHDPYPWITGKHPETQGECLRSLLASYIFRHSVETLKADGVDFQHNLYQPEVSSVTGETLLDREDHGHVLKRLTTCLRNGSIPDIDLKTFSGALQDPQSGLTYESLTGKNKQSIPDCERLFSMGVHKYMEKQGHMAEAEFVSMIQDWHKAFDGRGLMTVERRDNCKRVLDWLLDDWMPWHSNNRDFSTLDINRPIKGIRGLTQEVIVALIANIEGYMQRSFDYAQRGIQQANPRSGTSDDVEGLFSTIREMIGEVFGMKEFYENYPKIMAEYEKKINPDLPFYYWTGYHLRYRDFELPDFDKSDPSGVERLDVVKFSRRADPGAFISNRASMPQHKSLTVRAKFHKAPESLPPTELPV